MRRHLIIAPHPDDETLGCGGLILHARKKNEKVFWMVVTKMSLDDGFTKEQITIRDEEIDQVAKSYDVTDVFRLDFPPAKLDTVPVAKIVQAFSNTINTFTGTTLISFFDCIGTLSESLGEHLQDKALVELLMPLLGTKWNII